MVVSTQVVAQAAVNALSLSLIYVLISLGLTLIFSIMHMVNFAHGELYMLGGFGLFVFFEGWGVPYAVTLVVTMALVTVVGLAIYRMVFRPLRLNFLAAVLASLGVGLVIQNGASFLFGDKDQGVHTVVSGGMNISGVYLTWDYTLVAVGGAALAVALVMFIRYTRLGRALRSVSEDRDAASLQGINVNSMDALGFGIASALAAAAGGLMSPLVAINPYMGGTPMLKGFIVILMGGLGSIPGAILAGFILGFIESFGMTFIGYAANLVGFAIVILILVVRPRGLLGHELAIH